MLIRLRRGITLQQGTFTAIIAPEHVIHSALHGNPDLGQFLSLFLCGNNSFILPRIDRASSNFEICSPFTADQLLTCLKEACHTVIFIEHDPALFEREGADLLLAPVAGELRHAGHEALVILYSPVMDRSFAALAFLADRVIEIVHADEPAYNRKEPRNRSRPQGSLPVPEQQTPGGF